jgi:ubiquinone biosynthesis protein COQ4
MSVVDRMTLAVSSAVTALADPTRADAVATLGEVTGSIALRELHQKMLQHPTGQLILQEKPTVDNSLLEREDCQLAASVVRDDEANSTSLITFGQEYAGFMQHHGFHPEARDAVKYIDDPELAYVMLRYRQIHDFSHVLCDLPPTVLGELALKWLELLQTGLPVAALSVTAGALQLSPHERQILSEVYLPWAVETSQQSECLMNVYFEQEFDTNLHDLRNKIGLVPVPRVDDITMRTSVDR